MTSSYLTDLAARSHREDLHREAGAARATRRARRQATKNQNDYGETRAAHGAAYRAWNWLATAQL